MKRFYTNKYPVLCAVSKENELSDLPIGTVFTVKGISGNFFSLEPVEKADGEVFVSVDALMLQEGFTGTDHINSN